MPVDPSKLAKKIIDMATGEDEPEAEPGRPKMPKRRHGGAKGGAAKARALTPEERQDIARTAARARWKKSD